MPDRKAAPPGGIPMVGDVYFYPTGDGKDASALHRCIVVAIDRDKIYLAPVCTYTGAPNQDGTCVIGIDDMPGGELTKPRSYVSYRHLLDTPHANFESVLNSRGGRPLCRLQPDLFASVLGGLETTKWLEPRFATAFFGETRNERFARLEASPTVPVEKRHPSRSVGVRPADPLKTVPRRSDDVRPGDPPDPVPPRS